MQTKRWALAGIIAGSLLWPIAVAAQNADSYKIRLAPVAITIAMRGEVSGSGQMVANLAGNKLTVSGTFEGLPSDATAAAIHQGSMAGVRGPNILDLTIAKAKSGNFSGSFDLKPEQVEALKKGRWYVQIESEKAPEGTLWGWFMK